MDTHERLGVAEDVGVAGELDGAPESAEGDKLGEGELSLGPLDGLAEGLTEEGAADEMAAELVRVVL
ncbi:MAG: hypothetical protein C7B46_11590 [Sulfobacillus benefaciens]|uniref:Uncharacterized protein n=1 Tax=Sulfobacillus benefaciens TaxID=453960 RepID=A0A2T2XEZ8_9FIRM|nr:MAG: hypothetical protein C7B46_11590 [Sulfobacillus benefaciens]